MTEILAATIGFAGVIVGVCLTSILGFFSEIQKAKIQREHHKFTTYHSEQSKALTYVFTLLCDAQNKFRNSNDWVWDSYLSLNSDSLKELELNEIGKTQFIDSTNPVVDNIFKINEELKAHIDKNAIYLDDLLCKSLILLTFKLSDFSVTHIVYKRTNGHDKALFYSLISDFKLAEKEISIMKNKVQSTYKELMDN